MIKNFRFCIRGKNVMKRLLIFLCFVSVGCSRNNSHEEFLKAAQELEKSWSHEDYVNLKQHSFYCSCQSEDADFYNELFKYLQKIGDGAVNSPFQTADSD